MVSVLVRSSIAGEHVACSSFVPALVQLELWRLQEDRRMRTEMNKSAVIISLATV